MMSIIDKNFVKNSFNSSAYTYDNHAGLQKRMVKQLLALLDHGCTGVSKILDVGMGTGNFTAGLKEKFPAASVHGCDLALSMVLQARDKLFLQANSHLFLTADTEFLPYKDSTFDLIASSFTYQWLGEWDRALEEAARALKPGGIFVFSVFGGRTFFELRRSYKKACMAAGYKKGEAFEIALTEEKIRQNISSCGFTDPFTQTRITVETYPGVNEVVRSIKGMGARNASERRNKTPGVRKVWKKMVEIYEQDFGVQNKIPATFEIIMGRGKKGR